MLTEDLRGWIDSHKLGLPVVVTGGQTGSVENAIELSLAGVEQSVSLNDTAARPLRLLLTYRLTFRAKDPEKAHRALCEFMFAVMAAPAFVPAGGTRPLPVALLQGDVAHRRYGAGAGPGSVHLEVVAERPRHEQPTQLVREPAVVRAKTLN